MIIFALAALVLVGFVALGVLDERLRRRGADDFGEHDSTHPPDVRSNWRA